MLEGHVLIYVDTSPSIMITPTTFFHHVQHAEEYRQSASVGTLIRWFFFLGILASTYSLLVKQVSIYPVLEGFGIGFFAYMIELFDGITCLDSLEHRLTRKLDE